MRLFHRSTEPWEVVECKAVEAVPTYNDDELEEMQIMRVYSSMIDHTYLFDLKSPSDLRRAVIFARNRLLQEAAQKEYNIFLSEGWSVTHLRKGKRHRAEVRYTARPAYAITKARSHLPPFLAMLDGRDSP